MLKLSKMSDYLNLTQQQDEISNTNVQIDDILPSPKSSDKKPILVTWLNKNGHPDITNSRKPTKQQLWELIKKNCNYKAEHTSSGGKNTNINGKKLENKCRECFEKMITLKKRADYCTETNIYQVEDVVMNGKSYLRAPERAFEKYEEKCGHTNLNICKAHGAVRPDDCFINEVDKIINWIECKIQNDPGSVGEKLQTFGEKKLNLSQRFPDWQINYCYVINPWIKENFQYEIQRLDEMNIPYVVDSDEDFENKILQLIK